jgi:hypothetical protein
MALPLGTDVEYIGENASGGMSLGKTASILVSLHGVTPVAQATAITTVVSGTAATTATYGVLTPDVTALITAVNAIIVALRNKGITAT